MQTQRRESRQLQQLLTSLKPKNRSPNDEHQQETGRWQRKKHLDGMKIQPTEQHHSATDEKQEADKTSTENLNGG